MTNLTFKREMAEQQTWHILFAHHIFFGTIFFHAMRQVLPRYYIDTWYFALVDTDFWRVFTILLAYAVASSFLMLGIAKKLKKDGLGLRLLRGIWSAILPPVETYTIPPEDPDKKQKKDQKTKARQDEEIRNEKLQEIEQARMEARLKINVYEKQKQTNKEQRKGTAQEKKVARQSTKEEFEQKAKPLKAKYKQLKLELDQKKNEKINLGGFQLSYDKYQNERQEFTNIEQQLATLKEKNIKSVVHNTPRAFKELPHFFKFPLIKINPRRPIAKTSLGQMQHEPISEIIDYQQVKAEITYYGGELGDQDRMVWLAVMNQAIRNRDFVKEFGWIPYSREDIANEIGMNDTARKTKVSDALERLALTRVKFESPFGDFAFKGAFHLLDSVVSVESKKVKADINDKLQPILPWKTGEGEPPNPIITPEFAAQAKTMLERIKPKAPKINLIRFHANLMDAILGNQVTTIDLWAIKDFTPTEKTLFLYLYDISQWRTSSDPLSMTMQELMILLDLKPHTFETKGKEYTDWSRSKNQIEKAMVTVEATLKHTIYHSWNGDGEESVLLIQFSKSVKQIPNHQE